MRIIVAGSRDFTDYNFLRDKLDFLLSRTKQDVTIISGCARGVVDIEKQKRGDNSPR